MNLFATQKASSLFFTSLLSITCAASSAFGQAASSIQSFSHFTSQMNLISQFEFGTASGRNIPDINTLSQYFNPYAVAGTTPVNEEWERYQPFNPTNFVFTPNTLDLTATLPPGGGLYPGGINSGQIWSNFPLQPQVTGYNMYAMEIRMKIPMGQGMWPAAWIYSKYWWAADSSEVDIAEFNVMNTQDTWDWTSNVHGPGAGSIFYSIQTNKWVWHPGLNFASDYHDYQMIWTPGQVYRYVDGTLIRADNFKWTASGPASLGVNLAVGSNLSSLAGLTPTSTAEFPAVLSVEHISIWGSQ